MCNIPKLILGKESTCAKFTWEALEAMAREGEVRQESQTPNKGSIITAVTSVGDSSSLLQRDLRKWCRTQASEI